MKKLVLAIFQVLFLSAVVTIAGINCSRPFEEGVSKYVAPKPLEVHEPPPVLAPAQPNADSSTESVPGVAAPAGATSVALEEMRVYLLDLINADRQSSGLPPVILGINTAAQQHAEELLEYSYLSHWNMDGLKPYMRYTTSGGVNYEAENVSGIAAPIEEGRVYQEQSSFESILKSQQGFMKSSGHRANVLNKWHKKVNLGIACNQYTCAVVQQFEGDYVSFSLTPNLRAGRFAIEGILSGPFALSSVEIWYDEPPHRLTLAQLDITYMYRLGQRPAVFIREPAPPGSFYLNSTVSFYWKSGIDPYLADADSPRNRLVCTDEMCVSPTNSQETHTEADKIPFITADVWEVSERFFKIEADIASVQEELGPGVYTVVLWGKSGEESAPLTNYSIFVN